MIGTEELEHLIKLALLSAYVKGERPVSVLISARVESGKTEILRKAIHCDGVLYIADATAYGIQKQYIQEIADGKIKTIVIPDLITPLSKSSDTVETFVSFLNGLIEEGIAEVQTYAMSLKLRTPSRCNIITSIAKEHLFDQRHRWSKIGFLSRVIPVSYEYAASTVYDIMQSIATREYHSEPEYINLSLPSKSVDVELPAKIAKDIAAFAPQVIDSGKFAGELYGFRLQKQLQTLCMANTLLEGRTKSNDSDFNTIKRLSNYINLRFKQI